MFETGNIINSRYEIIRKIGEGGTSRVYLVTDRHIGRYLAMKVMDRKSVGAFAFARSEIESLRAVDHPLIPRIHDAFCEHGSICIVSDHVPGRSLWDMCRGRGLSADDALVIAAGILEALSYLHSMKKPVLYLDLKPENIIISDDGKPHLIDFGIAGCLSARHIPVGTIGYSPPEQYRKDCVMDARADIYAFGMTYFAIRHGIPPDRDPKIAYDNILHSSILDTSERSFLTKCCAPSRKDRYNSAAEILRQIEHIIYKPVRIRKTVLFSTLLTAVLMSGAWMANRIYVRIEQNETAARLVADATRCMEDGNYTAEGLGILKACIGSDCLSEQCEQELIFEVAMGSMLVSHDYRTAATYFAKLDVKRYPEVSEYIKLCNLESRFDYDPEEALNVTGRIFSDIAKRAPSKMKYENMIFIAGCYENYDTDPYTGTAKALSVLRIARRELDDMETDQRDAKEDGYSDMRRRLDQLIEVKEERLKIRRKIGEGYE